MSCTEVIVRLCRVIRMVGMVIVMYRSDCQTVQCGQNGGHGDVSCTEVIVRLQGDQNGGHGDVSCTEVIVRLFSVVRMVGMVMCHVQK